MKEIICVECGKVFEAETRKKRICSDVCKKLRNSRFQKNIYKKSKTRLKKYWEEKRKEGYFKKENRKTRNVKKELDDFISLNKSLKEKALNHKKIITDEDIATVKYLIKNKKTEKEIAIELKRTIKSIKYIKSKYIGKINVKL